MYSVELFIFLLCYVQVKTCHVTITDNGPVVSGAEITFVANLYEEVFSIGTFKYVWKDNAIPPHSQTFTGDLTNSTWTVSFPKGVYNPRSYEVEIDVYRVVLVIEYRLCSANKNFNITSYLNGNMGLAQNNSTMNKYVSTAVPVQHNIILNEADEQFLKKNASSILTYWFVDCIYRAVTPDMSFLFNYTDAGHPYIVEAVLVASHEPLPPVPPTNSTITTTTTTTAATTKLPAEQQSSSKSSTTIDFVHLSTDSTELYDNSTYSNDIENSIYSVNVSTNATVSTNQTYPPYNAIPFRCSETVMPPDPKKTYGLFAHSIIPKDPVSGIKVEGNAWIQHGDLLNLEVSCNGTGPFSYCTLFKNYVYNVTGNESCPVFFNSPSCEIPIRWYLSQSTTYTMLLIVHNDVNKIITPVGINIYEATKHAQLSVIIVPVSATIIAVISIIFGIGYYVQSKRRYTIEVADFDFSHASDLEYKTFYERLVESVSNAFNKEEEYSEQDSICAGTASRKYGNMQ